VLKCSCWYAALELEIRGVGAKNSVPESKTKGESAASVASGYCV
jgi:hypothetical protein